MAQADHAWPTGCGPGLAIIGDFAAMNEVWDAWVVPASPPARACVEAKLAGPELLVEMSVIATR